MDKHLLHYKGSKRLIFIVGLLTVIQTIILIVQARYLAAAIVNMYEGTAWKAVLPLLAIFIVAFILRHLIQWIKEKLTYQFAEDTANEYQQLLLKKLFALGPRMVGKEGTGQLVTLVMEGIPQFRTYLRLFIPRVIAMVCVPIILFIYVTTLDLASGVILAVVMPIMIIFLILLGMAAQKQMDAQWETYQLLSRHFVDSLRGLVTLKYLGKSKSHAKSIETVSNKYRIATNRTLRVAFLSTFSLDFFASLSVAIIAVELGLRLINGHIILLPALLILILAPEYFLPVRELGNDYHATMDGKEAGEKIHQILAMKTIANDQAEIAIPAWTKDSVLSLKNVSMESEEGLTRLENLNFDVRGIQKIGIVGTSGSGKSTLIDLLTGFLETTSGEISCNRQKIPHFSLEDWQKQLTYIPQHPHIFAGTIAENIRLYAPDAPKEKVKEAADKVGLTALVSRFPNGLEEVIGQGGRNLSGGEEQRVALARGLLQDRPIMLLDEPTAHLDIETEYELKKAMLPLMEGKLVFFATHRLHWMQSMDWIFVMENGKLVETGHYHDLIQRPGTFSALRQAQKGGDDR
ncbi:thiol reductant ABC exporter subunit CydD [Bacillus sp. SD088]|uniref:thiol reductant ABC exporter subunit CydD n=1 Tax=Bacillus sp. SD088 TaxID=2782012 RepID=UPI001A96D1D2|nr:thiol reductant ABC exporter subunit CydD [Bacillus sp. SD088]MBO0993403.1 thiol reductant ABC exporter subunit CydD [Bacillus sp. SD088]